MSYIPKPHEIYKHFKGNLYQITAVAEHTETGEQLVIYQALYGDFKIYARPLEMFVGRVDKEKYPDAAQEYRFELQTPGADTREREQGAGVSPEKPAPKPVLEEEKPASKPNPDPEEEELDLDPMVLEFLDADSYEERLNILTGLHHRITDDMITIMAVACDVEVEDGETEDRYTSLKNCLLMMEKYECNRLR